ncbi:FAD/NAD(P)-binding domain-containing protein [Clavulina sp. PMI_390]|nr:FAD/NAD(P)-binding domain-containing protein [Clavulina sp. PMI_390]
MASPSSQPPKVIIVGAGIAGPILAVFLKLNGYSPVIYERQSQSAPGGICLTCVQHAFLSTVDLHVSHHTFLQPNGLRVLEMIPGLLPKISGAIVDSLQFYSVEPSDPGLLAHSQIIADLVKEGQLRYPWTTVNRGQFHDLILAEATEVYGVPIFYDHSVVDVVENEEEGSVSVRFADGRSDSAAFVVGCDGLHSNTRVALFGREKADFTGMTQMGGMSPFPVDETLRRGMTNLYGDGLHFLSYPTSDETICWIITQHENEAKETWKPMDDAGQEEVRQGPYSQLPYGAGELVRTCKQIVKYGLYDRPELKSWYRGRVVLLGDAAHPTSPHLGQGANQSFEDVYHLVRLLNKHNGGTSTNFMQQDVAKAVYPPHLRMRMGRMRTSHSWTCQTTSDGAVYMRAALVGTRSCFICLIGRICYLIHSWHFKLTCGVMNHFILRSSALQFRTTRG